MVVIIIIIIIPPRHLGNNAGQAAEAARISMDDLAHT